MMRQCDGGSVLHCTHDGGSVLEDCTRDESRKAVARGAPQREARDSSARGKRWQEVLLSKRQEMARGLIEVGNVCRRRCRRVSCRSQSSTCRYASPP